MNGVSQTSGNFLRRSCVLDGALPPTERPSMFRPAAFAVLFALVPATVSADAALTITFDLEDVTTAHYTCGEDKPLALVYVVSEAGNLALVSMDEGDARVFAEAVSGSGARYVSGQYEWITKGGTGLLINTLEDKTLLDCRLATP